MQIARAADLLLSGGVVAYPTEGVFGLGCMPDDPDAVSRLLVLKRRDPRKGLILIAAARDQLDEWLAGGAGLLPDPEPERPVTWVAPAADGVPRLIRGEHEGIAVRLTTHPVAAALCDAVDSALVSTSANYAGQRTVRNRYVLRRKFGAAVDCIVPGDCGTAARASEIRALGSGIVLRVGAA